MWVFPLGEEGKSDIWFFTIFYILKGRYYPVIVEDFGPDVRTKEKASVKTVVPSRIGCVELIVFLMLMVDFF